MPALFDAVSSSDLTAAAAALAGGADPNAAKENGPKSKPFYGEAPLFCAARTGQPRLVGALLGAGAKVEAKGPGGATALIAAAGAGHADVCAALLEAGAKVGAATARGATPMHAAALGGHEAVLTLLLAAGADADAPERKGEKCTPLLRAAMQPEPAAVAVLLAAGAKVGARSAKLDAPLHVAAATGHAAVLGLLLEESGGDLELTNKAGCTALVLAAAAGQLECLCVLLGAGAAVGAADKHGQAALHHAALKNQCAAAELLLGAGAAVDAPSKKVCAHIYAPPPRALPAAVNSSSDPPAAADTAVHLALKGGTALDICCAKDSAAFAAVLLEHGASLRGSGAGEDADAGGAGPLLAVHKDPSLCVHPLSKSLLFTLQ